MQMVSNIAPHSRIYMQKHCLTISSGLRVIQNPEIQKPEARYAWPVLTQATECVGEEHQLIINSMPALPFSQTPVEAPGPSLHGYVQVSSATGSSSCLLSCLCDCGGATLFQLCYGPLYLYRSPLCVDDVSC